MNTARRSMVCLLLLFTMLCTGAARAGALELTTVVPARLGDVDNDGRIRITDVSWLQRKLAKMPIPGVFIEEAADVDGDGKLRIGDVLWVQRKLAKMPVPYPIGELI